MCTVGLEEVRALGGVEIGMLYEIALGEKTYRLELNRKEQQWECRCDGLELAFEFVPIDSERLYLRLNARSFDVRRGPEGLIYIGTSAYNPTVSDARSWRRRGQLRQSGPLQLTASMPGKVVRVLAREGDQIAAGQGILVIEAMKMQNEIKSPKAGTLQRILVREGVNVNSGEGLAVVE